MAFGWQRQPPNNKMASARLPCRSRQSGKSWRLISSTLSGWGLSCLCLGAIAAPPTPTPTPTASPAPASSLRVGIESYPPFVTLEEGVAPYGYSIDLWQAIAYRMGVEKTQYVEYESVEAVLDAVQAGEIDVGISGISITAEREANQLNFSYPYYQAGLQIVVPQQSASNIEQLVNYLGGWNVFQTVWRVLASSIVVGGLIWLLERRHNPLFQQGALAGIGQGLWFALVTLGTFGYGDVTPLKLPGRIIAVIWMGFSFFIVADFTASVVAARQQRDYTISGLEDLHGQRVAVIQGSTAVSFLKTKPVKIVEFEDFDRMVAALENETASAMVIDYPRARYFVLQNQGFLLAGDRLNREDFGLVVREDDTARLEAINRALLQLQRQEVFAALERKWFSYKQ